MAGEPVEPAESTSETENWGLEATAALEALLPASLEAPKTSSGVLLSPVEVEGVIRNVKDSKFFTLPGEVLRGKPFTIFVDVNKSEALKHCSSVQVRRRRLAVHGHSFARIETPSIFFAYR